MAIPRSEIKELQIYSARWDSEKHKNGYWEIVDE